LPSYHVYIYAIIEGYVLAVSLNRHVLSSPKTPKEYRMGDSHLGIIQRIPV